MGVVLLNYHIFQFGVDSGEKLMDILNMIIEAICIHLQSPTVNIKYLK